MPHQSSVFNKIESGSAAVIKRGWLALSDNSTETIEVQRRRQSDGPEGRAEAPSRPGGGSSGGGGGGGGGRGSGGRSSGGGNGGGLPLPPWLIILIVVGLVLYGLFSGDGEPAADTPPDTQEVSTPVAPGVGGATPRPVASSTPAPSLTPRAAGGGGKTWTVMMYEDADDQVLEEDMMTDLNEAERVGSSDRVKIVAQVDRYRGAYSGDGNWTSARRYYITRDDDLLRINSKMVADLGEVSMADTKTLIDFVTWAIKTYPADNYALILSDHGMGWPGGFSDDAPKAKKDTSIALVDAAGSQMYLMEIDQALAEIRKQTGLERFELVGMDACLMAGVEVFTALAPHARYAVASQETEPALGWAYTSFLQTLTANPDANGAELGKMIVKSYIDEDQRIVDDKARAAYLRQGASASSGNVTSKQLAKEIGNDVTLTAVDLGALPALNTALNKLAYALQNENQAVVAKARTYARSYSSVFGDDVPASYLDLGNLAKLVAQESGKAEVKTAAAQVETAVSKFVVAEKHGPSKSGSTGVSIYFPNSKLYKTVVAGPDSYTRVASRFAQQSVWDDYLAFHYARRPFEPAAAEAVIPAANSRSQVPGAGSIEISALKLSATEAAPDRPVTIQAELKGKNIGYVYLFVGFVDANSKSIFVADMDYLSSPKTREVDGLFYPQWSDNETFNLVYKWNPTVFALSDGKKSVTALFAPASYGAKAEDAVYTLDGYYTQVDGEERFARLYFINKQLRQVFLFTGDRETGAPHEVIPQTGDKFTLLQKWLEADSAGKMKTVFERGETLTVGAAAFTWKELYAAAGSYQVGFIVSDLDGNTQEAYKTLTVK